MASTAGGKYPSLPSLFKRKKKVPPKCSLRSKDELGLPCVQVFLIWQIECLKHDGFLLKLVIVPKKSNSNEPNQLLAFRLTFIMFYLHVCVQAALRSQKRVGLLELEL